MKDETKPNLRLVSSTGALVRPKLKPKKLAAQLIGPGIGPCPRYLTGRPRELWRALGISKAPFLTKFDEGAVAMVVLLLDQFMRAPQDMSATKLTVLRSSLNDCGLTPRARRLLQQHGERLFGKPA